jgi:hypothetical protein
MLEFIWPQKGKCVAMARKWRSPPFPFLHTQLRVGLCSESANVYLCGRSVLRWRCGWQRWFNLLKG